MPADGQEFCNAPPIRFKRSSKFTQQQHHRQTAFPGPTQVALLGLEGSSDSEIWQYAKDHNFVIVSRDSDFQDRSLVAGHPPQVIWLKLRNHSKTVILNTLLDHHQEIEQALAVQNLACVEISPSNR